ncbi:MULTISPECIES: AraC family transcriptional regulator [Methylobacterium]|jgi:AraC-like DNA-binding protein|uniref:AraC family transcriptional regulator n=2 Tax=Methylobacterium TaxID=407 RepID=A0A2R4WME1_9HYPH|nr:MULTISPECIES: AraC family transcriptional regulator [Methylobacterium]MBZ6414538.1 AraC family transcriptional regulator [Methylobacterium sp.]AWB22665.1 AraC family transcriptional regulator [Methylobacterium currus]MBK3401082.1 AraC family transcriptional regulator [Methylobacterium ajmalii]MBK3411286.1 AraC family transcriptional regulator [Methylobacterium ajmalii]MBK3424775.1 AraC family transcriptional regulator [Methylobacterium ajmalii]
MADPLADVVTLLRPSAAFSKSVSGSGPWRVRRAEHGRPFYCAVLDGSCGLAVRGRDRVILEPGDFVLVPAADAFEMSSPTPPTEGSETMPVEMRPGEFRIGHEDGPADVRLLVGYCTFGSPDAGLLVSLLPSLVEVRGQTRLASLVHLVGEEARQRRPARDLILTRLLEVMLIEALRSMNGPATSPGLVRGLGDERLAAALRRMHERPTASWTVARMAQEAGLSRSVFFERFRRAVGVAPMEYLLDWRMVLAKDLLRREGGGVAEVAARVGYGSASTFSVAFSRHVGLPPAAYARERGVREVA